MAAEATPVSANIQMVFAAGTDETGKPLYSRKTLSNVDLSTTPTSLWSFALAFAGLTTMPLDEVNFTETSLIEEAY